MLNLVSSFHLKRVRRGKSWVPSSYACMCRMEGRREFYTARKRLRRQAVETTGTKFRLLDLERLRQNLKRLKIFRLLVFLGPKFASVASANADIRYYSTTVGMGLKNAIISSTD